MCVRDGRLRILSLLLTAVGAVAVRAGWAEEQQTPSAGPPSIAAVKVVEPPIIDGALDDPCWQEAAKVAGFWRERADAAELERTEAWVCHDGRAVYIAFRCRDSRPEAIRATQRKRQGSLENDDWARVSLDVENEGVRFYQFTVNPLGTQNDSVPGGTSEKIQWRGDWHAAARTDATGWTAELAIPFSILRYRQGQDTFRIYLSRYLAREKDYCHWPPCYARRIDGEQCARWTSLPTPPPSFRYVLMPYALSVASEEEGDREPLTGGLDFKGTLPNGLVALATYHPDFRNLEDVVETIDFTYTERWLPEYRPFFQEGSGYLPGSRVFYSRRLRELDWGLKLFGTLGSERFGILDAYRRGGENHLAWEYSHAFGTQASMGIGGSDRRVPGDPLNRVFNLNGSRNWVFEGGDHYLWANSTWSRTEGEGGDDREVQYGLGTERRQGWSWRYSHSVLGPDFISYDGYVPERGVRWTNSGVQYQRSYDNSSVLSRTYYLHYNFGHSQAGGRHQVWTEHSAEWRNGLTCWIGGDRNTRDGYDSSDFYMGTGWNSNDVYHAGGADFMIGKRLGEDYRLVRFNQAFRPSRRWATEASLERAVAASWDDEGNVLPPEGFTQVVWTTAYDISPERTLSGRLVRSGDDTNVYFAYRQRVREGMDLLIVVGDPNAPESVSRLAVKAIWCL